MPDIHLRAGAPAALSGLLLGGLGDSPALFARLVVAVVSVQIFWLAAAVPAVAADDEGEARARRFEPISELAGHCWTGEFENGARDVHCYEWTLQDGFVRDRHEVTGGEGVYAGETFYGWDASAEQLRFWYFNSLGGVSEGAVARDGDRWRFDESYRGESRSLELRTWLELPTVQNESADAGGESEVRQYIVTTEILRDGQWQNASRIVFTRRDAP